ncbi:hypothetical protein CJ030_MR1G014935 [Morella rubra]|uniref:Uncharacterized protein n=1 Tax=Morella rubra TaxID=262757 RepID=A0A6A1WQW1_9ROSI|nr:hypothetical protein CJ030_MR1G014935 [Morella rubra]
MTGKPSAMSDAIEKMSNMKLFSNEGMPLSCSKPLRIVVKAQSGDDSTMTEQDVEVLISYLRPKGPYTCYWADLYDYYDYHDLSPSLEQRLKSSLLFFPKIHYHHDAESLSPESKPRLVQSSSDAKPRLCWTRSSFKPKPGFVRTRSSSLWIKTRAHDLPELRDMCRNLMSRIGAQRHARHHSADFKYDALSYALNFEDDKINAGASDDQLPLRNFSSRLPPPPSSRVMITAYS